MTKWFPMKEVHPPCRWLHFLNVGEANVSFTGLRKVCTNPFIITEEKFDNILGLDVLKESWRIHFISYMSLIYLLDTRTCPTVSAAAPWKSCFWGLLAQPSKRSISSQLNIIAFSQNIYPELYWTFLSLSIALIFSGTWWNTLVHGNLGPLLQINEDVTFGMWTPLLSFFQLKNWSSWSSTYLLTLSASFISFKRRLLEKTLLIRL